MGQPQHAQAQLLAGSLGRGFQQPGGSFAELKAASTAPAAWILWTWRQLQGWEQALASCAAVRCMSCSGMLMTSVWLPWQVAASAVLTWTPVLLRTCSVQGQACSLTWALQQEGMRQSLQM